MINLVRAATIALAVAFFAIPVLPAQQSAPTPAPFQIHFFAQVDYSTVNQLIAVVDQQLKLGTKDFYLLIASPGGDPTAGLAAYNYLHGLNANVTTFNLGDVDSAANIIYCAGKHRYALPGTRFLIHGASWGAQPGQQLDSAGLDAQLSQIKNLNAMMVQVIGSATNGRTKDLEEAVRTQKILSAEEAKTWGLVEEVRTSFIVPGATLASIGNTEPKPEVLPLSPFTSISGTTIGDHPAHIKF